MENLEDKVLTTIRKYNLIENGDNVVVGVSGGPDSMTLLHVLLNLKDTVGISSIIVAHINHMIRKEADGETEFVQKYCEDIGIECYVKKIDVQKEAEKLKISTELAGRNIRYAFFEEVAQKVKANKIATAHNANDNAETVLMNLLRGSGTSGLKGIEKIRDEKFIRPILECTRKQIEAYVQEKELNPRYDSTNNENIYTRNKIRNELIPFLEREFNPNIVEGLNRLSTIVAKEETYFHKIVENTFEKLRITGDNLEGSIVSDNLGALLRDNTSDMTVLEKKDITKLDDCQAKIIILDLKQFNQLDEVIKSRLILYTINKLLGATQGIEKIHIEDIIKLCGNNIGNKYLSPNKKVKVFLKKGRIFFIATI